MEPRIRYAQTGDGVSIAFWAHGDGAPLIAMPSMPWSHIKLEWSIPEVREWYERLSHGRRLIRYDGRGFGLSDRDVNSMTLEEQILDLAAVVEAIDADEYDLYAGLHSGPVAIAYAARHPDRVRRLVLFCSYDAGADFGDTTLTQATRPLINQDWDFYADVVARLLLGWTEPAAATRFADLVRACVEPETAALALATTRDFDVTDDLASVQCPTLVMHRREVRIGSFDYGRRLAAGIPGADFAVVEGVSVAPYLDDAETVLTEIATFLGGPSVAPVPETSALRTILFTDVEGSTTLTDRLGDDESRAMLRAHEAIVRAELASHGGVEIKTMGDGFMASFGSAAAAVRCALSLQHRLAADPDLPITIRVGVNAGEPIAEDGDLYGTAVNIAARLGSAAQGGQILVSDVVRQLVAGKGFSFTDLGEISLRGIDRPVRIHEAHWAEPTTQ